MDTLEHFFLSIFLNHNQHIYIRHEETNEINCISKFWIPFLFSSPSVGAHSVCCVPFLAWFPCMNNKLKHQVTFAGYRECLLFKSLSYSAKKILKNLCVYQCDSPYPHHAVNDVNIDLMAWLQGPLRTDKACSMKINLVGLGPCWDTIVKEGGRWSGNRTDKKQTLCWL